MTQLLFHNFKIVLSIICFFCSLIFINPSYCYDIELTPRITVSEEFTSNLYLSHENEEEDYITTIAPGLTLELTERNNGFLFSYDPEIVYYYNFPENNSIYHTFVSEFWADLTRNTRLTIRDTYISTQDSSRDDEEYNFSIRTGLETYYTNTASVRLDNQFGEADTYYIECLYTFLENDDENIEDYDSYSLLTGLSYWFSNTYGVETELTYTKAYFSGETDTFNNWESDTRLIKKYGRHIDAYVGYAHTVMNYEGDTVDYHIYNPYTGVEYRMSERTTLSGEIGYFYYNSLSAGEDQSGLSTDGNINYQFRRGTLNFSGSQGYQQTYFATENLGFTTYYALECMATYNFTQYLLGEVSASFGESKSVYNSNTREDRTKRAEAGLHYQIIDWLSVGLGYAYQSMNSTITENCYDEHRILFSITAASPEPIRIYR